MPDHYQNFGLRPPALEPVVLHVIDKITPFARHSNLDWYLFKKGMAGWYFPSLPPSPAVWQL
jgi:hypothetical protein